MSKQQDSSSQKALRDSQFTIMKSHRGLIAACMIIDSGTLICTICGDGFPYMQSEECLDKIVLAYDHVNEKHIAKREKPYELKAR